MILKTPTSLDAPVLTDWLEFNVLFGDDKEVSIADVRRMLEPLNVETRKGRGRTSVDTLVGSIQRQTGLRRRLAGASYPIAARGDSFSPAGPWEDFLPYVFLLLCSLAHHYQELGFTKGSSKRPAELLGFLSVEALIGYLGGSAVRFDSPRRMPLPSGFKDALAYVGKATSEPIWPVDFSSSAQKDDGLDVLAWKSLRMQEVGK